MTKTLRDAQKIRLIVDGVSIYCRVRNLQDDPVLRRVLADFKAEREIHLCIGRLARYNTGQKDVDIQIDMV